MRITIEITLGNEAMRTGDHVAGILRDLANRIDDTAIHGYRGDEGQIGTARDANGNTVARMVVIP